MSDLADTVAHDRFLEAGEDIERDALLWCLSCDQWVWSACSADCEIDGE